MRGAILHGVLEGKNISVHVTEKAMSFLEQAEESIYVKMELCFTSLMTKKVSFDNKKPNKEVTKIADNIYIYFESIQSISAKVKDLKGDNTDLIAMPVARNGALIPKYVRIDRKNDKWIGDFTWKSGSASLKPLILNYN